MTYPPPPSGDEPPWPRGNPPPPGDQPPWPGGNPSPSGDQPPWPPGSQYPRPGGQPGWQQPGPQATPGYPPPPGGYQPGGGQQGGYQQQPGWNQQPGWAQQPGWNQQPRPQRPRRGHTGRNVLIGVGTAVVVLIVLGVIGAAVGSHQNSGGGTSATGSPGGGPSEPTPGPAATGGVGTTFKITGTDDNGKPMSYDVTLISVSQTTTPDNSFDAASAGHHLAGAEFKITGLTGSSHDDANLDANVSGSNDQSYTASFSGLAAGTNFSDGDFTVAPGQTEVGYVSFELPNSVQVGDVTWDPNLDGAIATWKVQ
jgi:hypothetical protein